MRLIDADNVISVCEILSEKGGNPHYWNQLISIIEDMATIDAIPVEWLEKQASEQGPYSVYCQAALEILLDDWKKEQEAR